MRLTMVAILYLLVPWAVWAQTDVETWIHSRTASRIPLAMAPFSALDGTPADQVRKIEQLVTADLEFSGVFKVYRGHASLAAVRNKDELVEVRGALFLNDAKPHFEGRVVDVSTKQQIGGKRYKFNEKQLRQIAHHFADEVVHLLTGEMGIASTRILYRRKRDDHWEIVLADYDGYHPRVLLRQTVPLLYPKWIDGDQAITYSSFRYGQADLFLRYLREPSSNQIASYPGMNYSVDWSNHRRELVGTLSKDGNPEIYILDLDGKVRRRLTHNRAIETSPTWAPSGREVLFTSDRSGTPQIYVMEANGSNVRRLTFEGSYCDSPAWSPKGDLIAFVARIDGFFQLCTIRPDGSGFVQITNDGFGHEDPRWAPNGRHIVYSEKRGGESVISIIDIGTGGRRILSSGDSPDWSSR